MCVKSEKNHWFVSVSVTTLAIFSNWMEWTEGRDWRAIWAWILVKRYQNVYWLHWFHRNWPKTPLFRLLYHWEIEQTHQKIHNKNESNVWTNDNDLSCLGCHVILNLNDMGSCYQMSIDTLLNEGLPREICNDTVRTKRFKFSEPKQTENDDDFSSSDDEDTTSRTTPRQKIPICAKVSDVKLAFGTRRNNELLTRESKYITLIWVKSHATRKMLSTN